MISRGLLLDQTARVRLRWAWILVAARSLRMLSAGTRPWCRPIRCSAYSAVVICLRPPSRAMIVGLWKFGVAPVTITVWWLALVSRFIVMLEV